MSTPPDLSQYNVPFDVPLPMKRRDFWKLVDFIHWNECVGLDEYQRRFMLVLNWPGCQRARDQYTRLYRKLDKAAPYMGVSDDTRHDLISHMIGLGEGAYNEALVNPQVMIERLDKDDYSEGFGSVFPDEEDYVPYDIEKFKVWARENIVMYRGMLTNVFYVPVIQEAMRIIQVLEGLDKPGDEPLFLKREARVRADVETIKTFIENQRKLMEAFKHEPYSVLNMFGDLKKKGGF